MTDSVIVAAEVKGQSLQECTSELEYGVAALTALQGSEAPLARFLIQDFGVNPRVAGYLIGELGLKSMSDFAEFWAAPEFETRMRCALASIACLNDLSQPASKLQAARLRAAGSRARATAAGGSVQAAGVAPAVAQAEDALAAVEARGQQLQALMSELEYGAVALEALKGGKAPLVQLLVQGCGVSPRVVGYLTHGLAVEDVPDFAELWTAREFEAGACDVLSGVASFSDLSLPASKLQAARLRAAWRRAQVAVDPDKSRTVGMGWTTPAFYGARVDDLWAALAWAARHPEDFMDVSEVVVAERQGFLARAMTVNATGKHVKEHIYVCEKKGEVVYRPVAGSSESETEDERVIAVQENPLRLELFHRKALDGSRSNWEAPMGAVQRMLHRVLAHANKIGKHGHLVGLGFCSEEFQGVSHDAVWQAMMESIREPSRFLACSVDFVREGEGFVHRSLVSDGVCSEERIYADELSHELVHRDLVNGVEADVERVITLRAYPLQVEFHKRSRADGFRVYWDAPKASLPFSVEALLKEAKRMGGVAHANIGYGITSDPICGCSKASLFAAVELGIREPWRVFDVDQAGCELQDCEGGHVLRTLRLRSTGKRVVERIAVSGEALEAVFNKCGARGEAGEVERVLAVRTPLRLEFYERSTRTGLRTDWRAPCEVARGAFAKLVQLARQLEAGQRP